MIKHDAIQQILMECGPVLAYDPNCERIVYFHEDEKALCVAENELDGWITFHMEPYVENDVYNAAKHMLDEWTELEECPECSHVMKPTLTAYRSGMESECTSCGRMQ